MSKVHSQTRIFDLRNTGTKSVPIQFHQELDLIVDKAYLSKANLQTAVNTNALPLTLENPYQSDR